MLGIQIFDGGGLGHRAKVTGDQELCVIGAAHPPLIGQKANFFRQYLTDDGTPSGSEDMAVDGSVSEQRFYVGADPEKDRWITHLSVIVGYTATGKPFQWCAAAALGNGSELSYTSSFGSFVIHDAIKSNQDMFRLGPLQIGSDWEVRHVDANNDYGYFVDINLLSLMPPFGLKLDAGSNQTLALAVRDNLSANTQSFNMIAYGFERFE